MTSPPARDGELPARLRGWLHPLVILALVVGGVLSLGLKLLADTLADEQLGRAVERAGRTRGTALRIALEEDIEAVVALRAFWQASEEVTRGEFEAFTQPLLARHPAISALEWAPTTAPEGIAELEQKARADGLKTFAVHAARPEGTDESSESVPRAMGAKVLHPVLYAEPRASNAAVLGLDLASEPRRRAALESAEAAQDVRASEPVELYQTPGSIGLILALPVPEKTPPASGAHGASHVQGFAIGVLELRHALEVALDPLVPEDLRLHVTLHSRGREVLALDTPEQRPGAPGASAPAWDAGSEGRLVDGFELAGLSWQVHAAPGPGLADKRAGLYAWLLLSGGLALTLSLAFLLSLRENRARELEQKNLELAASTRERERVLDALRVSEQRFRLLFEHHGSIMLVVDPESGAIVDANTAAERFYGYPRERLRAMRLQDLDLLSEDEHRELLQRLRSEERGFSVVPHRLSDGARRTVEIHSTPIAQQGHQQVFAILHDISERESMQRRMIEAQKLESLGVLAGGIAHDFNNLLISVIGNAELAERQLPPGSPARRHIGATLKASQHAASLTRRLLAYAGQGTWERQPVDLSMQVREALELVAPQVPATVTVELDLAQDLAAVEGDRLQLQQVVVNLLLNAIEALEGRVGRVRVRTTLSEPSRSGVLAPQLGRAERKGPHVLLEVSDDGPGMDAATQARIFDPFFSTKFAGRGLGLASVLGVVRAHGGQLAVESTPGLGSRFRVWLPAASPSEERPGPAASAPRVLIVDDDPAVCEVTSKMLAAQGFEVEHAASGEEALQRLDEGHGFDVALVDLGLPRLGGAEMLRLLRSRAPELAVLVMSGHDAATAARRCGEEASAGFLQKPFSPKVLVEKVRGALSTASGDGAAPQGG